MLKKIVVIEDEDNLRTLVSKVLQIIGGYEVFSAADGIPGLELVRLRQPDLVISDGEMPGKTGMEVLKAMRNDPVTAPIPVILMTGQTAKMPLREAMLLGADDYLAKPFTEAELLETVRIRLARLEQMRVSADAKLEQLRTFMKNSLPHELLTPLTGIIGYSELMVADYDQLRPSEVLEMATGIQRSGHRLLRVIRNFLLAVDLERVGTDADTLRSLRHATTLVTKELITASARERSAVWNRTADLAFDLGDVPAAIGEDYLKKIIEELVDNACKFSPAGTPVQIASRSEAGHFILSLRDSGRGITPQQIAQIDPFQQFDRKRLAQQGMGLGLAIVRKLVELHEGSWHISSWPGAGSAFEIRLKTA